MPNHAPRRLLAVLVAFALTLAACGSDTGPSTVAASADQPTITLEAVADPKSGHNLYIEVDNVTIVPERASTEPVDGEGHLHLYVDGERTMRFYNTVLHLDGLDPGTHTIEVELSQNDHSPYETDGQPLRASAEVVVEAAEHSHHEHGTTVLDTELDPAPTVESAVTRDPKSGWNLAITTENFELAPRQASTEAADGEGHLHLYVDGEKVSRLYGPDWHIAALAEGTHTIEVELSHNDHSAYGVDGSPIRASATIEVSAEDAADSHDHSDSHDHGDSHDQGASANTGLDMSPADADVTVNLSFRDGEVEVEADRVDVELGSTIGIVIESDVEEEAHVHGYDYFIDVGPDHVGELVFAADVPGVFEIELESSGTFLFEIQVR